MIIKKMKKCFDQGDILEQSQALGLLSRLSRVKGSKWLASLGPVFGSRIIGLALEQALEEPEMGTLAWQIATINKFSDLESEATA